VDDLSVRRVLSVVDGDLQVAGSSFIFEEDVAELVGMLLIDFCHDLVGVVLIASSSAELDLHLNVFDF